MQITDNYLSNIQYRQIFTYFTSEDPIWRFMTNVTYGMAKPHPTRDSWGFSCNIFDSGDASPMVDRGGIYDRIAYKLVQPLILNKEKLTRIRCGLIVNAGPDAPHTPHIDQPHMEHYTQLYYLTASDGPTNVFEEYGPDPKYDNYKPEDFTLKFQSKPEPNRMFLFDGYHYHSSSHVYGNEVRIALTLNYAK